MMNPIKRALLARLDSKPLSNISEPKLDIQSEKVEESSDEEPPVTDQPKSPKSPKSPKT